MSLNSHGPRYCSPTTARPLLDVLPVQIENIHNNDRMLCQTMAIHVIGYPMKACHCAAVEHTLQCICLRCRSAQQQREQASHGCSRGPAAAICAASAVQHRQTPLGLWSASVCTAAQGCSGGELRCQSPTKRGTCLQTCSGMLSDGLPDACNAI